MSANDAGGIRPFHLSDYFRNYWLLGLILGRGDSVGQAWLRFTAVLALWIAFIAAACHVNGALHLDGPPLGLLEDAIMAGVCVWQLAGVGVLLYLLRKLDQVLVALPSTLKGGDGDVETLEGDIRFIRSVVTARHPTASIAYWILIATGFLLVGIFQIYVPLQPDAGARSWAIWPQRFPVLYAFVAIPWALFCYTVVFAHFVWFIFCALLVVFPTILRHVREDRISIPPIVSNPRNGLQRLGAVSLSVMLLASGGLLIAIPWYLQFEIRPGADQLIKSVMILYGVILFALYFGPLWFAHRALAKARAATLLQLGGLLSAGLERVLLRAQADRVPAEDFIRLAGSLGGFDSFYRRVEQMPTWPTSKAFTYIASLVSGSPVVTVTSAWDKSSWLVTAFRWLVDALHIKWLLATVTGA